MNKSEKMVEPFEIANQIRDELKKGDPLMGLSRRQRRRHKLRSKGWKKKFEELTTGFITAFFTQDINLESEEGVQFLSKWDNLWKAYARNQITKYQDVFDTYDKRTDFLGRFISFVDKFNENYKQKGKQSTINELIGQSPEKQEIGEVSLEEVREDIILTLKENGINTQARTVNGLRKAIDKLPAGSTEHGYLTKVLSSVK